MENSVKLDGGKRVLVFDLDGTLTPSKASMTREMTALFVEALNRYAVGVISGGSFLRFEKQLLSALPGTARFGALTLLPTCGTQRYEYNGDSRKWDRTYIDSLTDVEKQQIHGALTQGIHHFGYDAGEAYGALIEDRESQITYSALGQDIVETLGEDGLRRKAAWDPDDSKKQQLCGYVAKLLPDYEVRISSPTSIDVSKPGMDKAYGVRELIELLEVSAQDVLFFGDRLEPGGNDYPVRAMGVDCVSVSSWQETAAIVARILDAVQIEENR